MKNTDMGYLALRAAIYRQAAEDYKRVLRAPRTNEYDKKELEDFFTSGAYQVDPEVGKMMMEKCCKSNDKNDVA